MPVRGGLLGTAPFHWDGDMTDFKQLVDDVMTGRMGGFPVNDDYAGALGAWIDKQPALCLPASDAAAEAPASPVPTTMMSNRRLLAGLTSFKAKRWLSHFCSIGPEGMLAWSSIAVNLQY